MVKQIINNFTENTYIISNNKQGYIIDPGADVLDIIDYLNKEKINLKGVLLTHGHFDHIISLNDILTHYNVNVYVHEFDRDFLFDASLNLSNTTKHKFIVNDKKKVVTFTEGFKLKIGGDEIRVMHTPGHTRGSSTFLYSNYCFTGDTLFKGSIGRSDLPTGDEVKIKKSLKRMMNELNDNKIIYPGHGHFSTILNEKMDNIYLK